uniref:AraC family transcriptional regulator n=1 Tax=Empedobacter sp. TaxID=1927715 RepID=UPI0028ACFE7C
MNKKDLSEYKKLNIFDGTEILFAKKHTLDFPKHTHDTFNIALVLDQTFNTKLNSKFLQAPTGTLCITNPDEIHATPCDKNIGNSFITFYIAPNVLTQINNGVDVFFKNKVIYNPKLFSSLYYLSQNTQIKHLDFEKELIKALSILVQEYSTEINFKHKETKLFQEFLQEEAFEKFSLEKTANRFGVNKFKFLRLFKQETGLTPNSYIILKRIEKAKQMLSENEDLSEVAFSSGFYDVAH